MTDREANELRTKTWVRLGLPEEYQQAPAGQSIRPEDSTIPGPHLGLEEEPLDSAKTAADEAAVDESLRLGESIRMRELPTFVIADRSSDRGGDLRVIEQIGEGGMGVVDRAEQRSLRREVAVKRVRRGDHGTAAIRPLVEEARITGSLEHPNIVPIHALGSDQNGDPVIVMKRIDGVMWSELIQNESHPFWESTSEDKLQWHLETLTHICRALEFAHSQGVVHRDLKPDNVMIGDFGEVYLLDWGIAVTLPESGEWPKPGGDKAMAVVGTPAYMAPEMVSGGPITKQTDVFQVGALLHEVLTCRPPHSGEVFFEMLADILADPPARREYPEETPDELEALCERALSPRPKNRHESVRALREAISQFLTHRQSTVLAKEAFGRLAELEALLEHPSADEKTHQAEERRIHDLQTECRFAFRQALRIWDGNDEARAGLDRCLRQMIAHELEEGHEAGATGLLAELSQPVPELEEELESLRKKERSERMEVERLKHQEKELDLRQFARERSGILIAFASILMVFAIVVLVWRLQSGFVPSYGFSLTIQTALTLLVTVWLIVKPLRQNLANRRLMQGFVLAMAFPFVVRLTGWRLGVPFDACLGLELAAYMLAAIISAIFVTPVFWGISGACAIGLTLAMILPDYVIEFAGMAIGLGLMFLAFSWRRLETENKRSMRNLSPRPD